MSDLSENIEVMENEEQSVVIGMSELQLLINEDLDANIDLSLYKTQYVETMIKNTVNIHCRMCKSDNVYVFTKQTRSSDEATTKYYTCIDCGNKWNVN
jgi:DNA-directed RNA polymerase subunit M/transcription elongation factor TFIIS